MLAWGGSPRRRQGPVGMCSPKGHLQAGAGRLCWCHSLRLSRSSLGALQLGIALLCSHQQP